MGGSDGSAAVLRLSFSIRRAETENNSPAGRRKLPFLGSFLGLLGIFAPRTRGISPVLGLMKSSAARAGCCCEEGILRDVKAGVAALKACSGSRDLEGGKAIHAWAIRRGQDCSNIHLASSLINMYAKCGCLVDARRVFDKMLRPPDVVLWTALILAYAENGQGAAALALFTQMRAKGCQPNARTLVALLKACASLAEEGDDSGGGQPSVNGSNSAAKLRALEKGRAIHAQVDSSGEFNLFVANSVLNMYAKCGSVADARKAFDEMIERDVISWNCLILGYAENGDPDSALESFARMGDEGGCCPNSRTFVAAMQACTAMAQREEGVRLHEMEMEGKLCKLKSLEIAFALHAEAAQRGFLDDAFVVSTLVDLYAKCGSLLDSVNAFQIRSVVAWTALVAGFAENGEGKLALELFFRLQEGLSPNCRTFSAALKACSCEGAMVNLGSLKRIHSGICRRREESDAVVGNGLVDAYAKCGRTDDSQLVFDSLGETDSIAWTSLISGYSHQGDAAKVLRGFGRMQEEGCEANAITLRCVLMACSHAGLLDKGRLLFQQMVVKHGIDPGVEHYICLADLLGRANELDAALEMVMSMPHQPNFVIWMTVLDACRKWKNVKVGRIAFEKLLIIGDKDCSAAAYDLMAGMFS